MSVTVFMTSGETVSIQNACQWDFTTATLELANENGESVGTFLAAHVTGCVSNNPPQQACSEGSHRDKTGDTFGFGAPDEEEHADDRD
jgi:hypothetical protein